MRKFYSVVLYLCAVSAVLNAADGQWAFVPSIRGPGWTVLDIVLAIACGLAGYGLWRWANRDAPPLARLRSALRGAHAAHALVTAGRLLGLSGAALLAYAVAAAHRWTELQQNWERSVPFGLLALVFLGAGLPAAVKRTVFPALGVIAAILITLPFGSPAHGAWGMFIAAIFLLAFGAVVLWYWLDEIAKSAETGRSPTAGPATFAGVLGGAGAAGCIAAFVVLRGGGLAPAGWWGLGVAVSGILALLWEVWLTPRGGETPAAAAAVAAADAGGRPPATASGPSADGAGPEDPERATTARSAR